MEAEKAEESPAFFSRCHLFFPSGSSHPLFSVITAAALLAALYLPRPLLTLLLSPVSISAVLLLAAFFRFGSPPTEIPIAADVPANDDALALVHQESMVECLKEAFHSRPKSNICDRDGQWGRPDSPLEVIYEDYEEEDAGGGGSPEWLEWRFNHGVIVSERLCNFKFDYADSGDSGSPEASAVAELWSSQDEIRLRWEEAEEEEEGDDMIEIELDEDSLIEIDISRDREAFGTAPAERPTAASFTGRQGLTYNLLSRKADM